MGNRQAREMIKSYSKFTRKTPVDESPRSEKFEIDSSVQIRRVAQEESSIYTLPTAKYVTASLHYLLKKSFQGNFSSPVHDLLTAGARVLDVGCGTGYWILDMAANYPLSTFVGIDSALHFPRENLPSNVEFIQVNILDGIPVRDEQFDFILVCSMCGCFTIRQWESTIIKEVARVLKNDCMLEWVEPDLECKRVGKIHRQLLDAYIAVFRSRGKSIFITKQIQQLLASVGSLVMDCSVKNNLPVGRWGDELGELHLQLALECFHVMKKRSMEFMSIYSDEFDALISGFIAEVEEYRPYTEFWRFCIKKVSPTN